MRSYRHIAGRALLVSLTLWALAMIIPDFYRVYQPLGSFGFYANNDGIVTDVQGPFLAQTNSPLFKLACVPGTGLISSRCAASLYLLLDVPARWRPWEAFASSPMSGTPNL